MTRSIRRKLTTAFLVVGLLFTLFVAVSLRGVSAYRRTVKDLELSIQAAPNREQLISVVSSLLTPFRIPVPDESQAPQARLAAIKLRSRNFREVLERAQNQFSRFDDAWKHLPEGLRFNPIHEMAFNKLLDHVDIEFRHIAVAVPDLENPDLHLSQEVQITREIADLIERIQQVPDPSHVLGERLALAQEDYKYYYLAVISTAILSLSTLVGLLFWGSQLIIGPVKRLLLGVNRVAGGEYNYRINTKTTCELSHLAVAFNKMADRFEAEQRDKQRQIEERSKQLVESARLADVGFLAAGVAHEINNPLTAIMSASDVLQYRLADVIHEHLSKEDAEEVREYLKLIVSEAERCGSITKRLLDFSHRSDGRKNLYDMTAIVQDVIGMVKHLGKYRQRTISFTRLEPLRAWVNGPEIKQVVLNLIANALDATRDGGEVRVSINELSEQLEIVVEDTGRGMTPDQLARIFEPFFTTKQVGQGTGLGLSISQRIVTDHGGTLDAESSGPGQGSTFRLRVPKSEAIARRVA